MFSKAKVKNVLKIKGKVGDLVLYQLNGQYVARKNSAPTKEMHDNAPEFELVRKLSKEFGGGSTGSKFIRDNLTEILPLFHTKDLNNRLTGVLREIIGREEGEKGRRPLKFVERKKDLKGFQIDSSSSVRFKIQKSLVNIENGIEVSWLVNTSRDLLLRPQSKGTHVRFVVMAVVVSDLEFDEEGNKYKPKSPMLSGLNVISYSDYISLDQQNMTAAGVCRLVNEGLKDEGIMILTGVVFYKKEGKRFDLHLTGNCMEINDVMAIER